MGLKLNTASSGSVTIEPTNTASNYTLTAPATNATLAINGPAFSAWLGSNQSISSGVNTKVQINTEVFDTNNNYDNSTNYRFTPTVAGYYQFNGQVHPSSTTSVTGVRLYKNGNFAAYADAPASNSSCCFSTVLYMNGSTDYVEMYAYIAGTSPVIFGRQDLTYFNGCLVRAA